MDKQIFNQAGVDAKQAEFFALTTLEQVIVINKIRSDFDGWMDDWFNLSYSQRQSIQSMDSVFKQQLATAIANNYANGHPINFTKGEKGDGIPDWKETIVLGLEDWQQPDNPNTQEDSTPLRIKIRYIV